MFANKFPTVGESLTLAVLLVEYSFSQMVRRAAAFIAGAALSLHHYAIEICFIAGAAAFYIGRKMKTA